MTEPTVLYQCAGGTIVLPARGAALADRADGGNLVINPPRPVWERSVLSVGELTAWAHLVSAAGQAMLRLPQLAGGCVNYWEAGNWALNDDAPPKGRKHAPDHRSVHMHLIGRSPNARSADHVWGEAPRFPTFARRLEWAAAHELLSADECSEIVNATDGLLRDKFGMAERAAFSRCEACGYPVPRVRHACPARA